MSLVAAFSAALQDATPAQVTAGMRVVIDQPWMTLLTIGVAGKVVTNMHFDPDATEACDFIEALESVPVGSTLTFRSDKVKTLGTDREFTVQFCTEV